jgi:hypothetical protein
MREKQKKQNLELTETLPKNVVFAIKQIQHTDI